MRFAGTRPGEEEQMATRLRFFMLLALIPVITLAARWQGSHSHARSTMAGIDWSELMGSIDKMHAAMASVEASGDSDVDFIGLMLPHHQRAIDMAKTELLYGKDPQMRRLAQEIITDQQSEIELMQLWLKSHGPHSQKVNQSPASDASGRWLSGIRRTGE
jgi:hypothetical protein